MRVIPQITAEIATMFALDPSQAAQAAALLAAMGRDSLETQSQTALDGCENVADAACWAALHAPYPWPWLAAELHEKIESRSEDFKGRKLFCALILRRGSGSVEDAVAPKGLSEALGELGACCADAMTCPSEALRMSAHRRLGLAEALDAGEPHGLSPSSTDHRAMEATNPWTTAPSLFLRRPWQTSRLRLCHAT